MISIADYFGHWADHPAATPERKAAAAALLDAVNPLLMEAEANGIWIQTNPHTSTMVSGETFGGFRPQDCPIGAPHSSHKEARAVDVYDPDNALDRWLTDARLEAHGLYREAPASTNTWCHLTDRAPGSGHRTFQP